MLRDYRQALEYSQRLVDARMALLGKGHADVATALIQVGGLHSQLCQHEQTLEYAKRALELRQALFPGIENETVAVSLYNVGVAYWSLGRSKEAL